MTARRRLPCGPPSEPRTGQEQQHRGKHQQHADHTREEHGRPCAAAAEADRDRVPGRYPRVARTSALPAWPAPPAWPSPPASPASPASPAPGILTLSTVLSWRGSERLQARSTSSHMVVRCAWLVPMASASATTAPFGANNRPFRYRSHEVLLYPVRSATAAMLSPLRIEFLRQRLPARHCSPLPGSGRNPFRTTQERASTWGNGSSARGAWGYPEPRTRLPRAPRRTPSGRRAKHPRPGEPHPLGPEIRCRTITQWRNGHFRATGHRHPLNRSHPVDQAEVRTGRGRSSHRVPGRPRSGGPRYRCPSLLGGGDGHLPLSVGAADRRLSGW